MMTATVFYHSPAPLMIWSQFLADVTGGDRAALDRLQEFAGSLGLADNRFDWFLALTGPIGETWAFIKAMIALAGPGECVQISPGMLADPARRGALANRRLALAMAHFEELASAPGFADAWWRAAPWRPPLPKARPSSSAPAAR